MYTSDEQRSEKFYWQPNFCVVFHWSCRRERYALWAHSPQTCIQIGVVHQPRWSRSRKATTYRPGLGQVWKYQILVFSQWLDMVCNHWGIPCRWVTRLRRSFVESTSRSLDTIGWELICSSSTFSCTDDIAAIRNTRIGVDTLNAKVCEEVYHTSLRHLLKWDRHYVQYTSQPTFWPVSYRASLTIPSMRQALAWPRAISQGKILCRENLTTGVNPHALELVLVPLHLFA